MAGKKTLILLFLILFGILLLGNSNLACEYSRLELIRNKLEVISNWMNIRKELSDITGLSILDIDFLLKVSMERDIPPYLFLSIIEQESNFNPLNVNKTSGATGLGQFMPDTAKYIAGVEGVEYSYEMLFDIEYNIYLMGAYLEYLYKKHKDWILVLSYYGGYGGVKRNKYIDRILSRSSNYTRFFREGN